MAEPRSCATKSPGFAMTVQCDECPWRTDVAPGRFPPERFRALASTVEQGFGNPIFACHKTPEDAPQACVGFLLVEGGQNWSVRMAAISGRLDYSKLEMRGPLYGSYAEMARANGVRAKRRR